MPLGRVSPPQRMRPGEGGTGRPAGEPLPLRVARVAPAAVAPSARPAPSAAMSRPLPVADAPAATAAKPASAVPAARTVEACGGTRITPPPHGPDPFALVQVDTLDTKRRRLPPMRTQ